MTRHKSSGTKSPWQMEGMGILVLGRIAKYGAKWQFLGCLTTLFSEIGRHLVAVTASYGYEGYLVFEVQLIPLGVAGDAFYLP